MLLKYHVLLLPLIAALSLTPVRAMLLPVERPSYHVSRFLILPGQDTSGPQSPGEQLDAARELQRVGKYEEAIDVYKTVLQATPPDAPEQVEARFSLGETYLLAGDYDAAVQTFAGFIERYPDDERYGQAVFLSGWAYQSAENWSGAITQYQKYLEIDSSVASWVYEVMGDCYLAAHDYAKAEEAYRRGLDGPIGRAMVVHLLEGIADAQLKALKYAEAAETYDQILENSEIRDYRARIEYQAGQALAAAGKTEEALARYFNVAMYYPTTRHAYLSLIEIVNAGRGINDFLRGLIDYHNEAYNPALRAFERYMQNPPEDYAGEAHYYAGLTHQALGDYAAAREKLDLVIERYPQGKYFGDAWVAKGQTWADEGKLEEAEASWRRFVELHPSDPMAPEALWRAGEMWARHEHFGEAARSYVRVHSQYPESSRTPTALHKGGLAAFRARDYTLAADAWQKLADGYTASPLRPGALYWLGRTYHALGGDDAARGYLDKVQRGYPGTYYAARAEEFAETWSSKLFQKRAGDNILLAPPTPEEQAEAEAWLASWIPVQPAEGESFSALSDNLAQEGRLQRALTLWRIGLTSDAAAQLRNLKADLKDSPLDLYRVALFLQDEGIYRLSVSYLERIVELAPHELKNDIPTFLLKLLHPFHFSELIFEEAAALKVDPLLLLALVRQESVFEWQVQSWAGAQGLMQIMPTTADWIALQIAWNNYKREIIYRPYINVRFGAWYFAHQYESFNQDAVAALTAYNAGPGRVLRWQTPEMAADDDLFLEYMPLSEPRLYVEKVFVHYKNYRELYAGE